MTSKSLEHRIRICGENVMARCHRRRIVMCREKSTETDTCNVRNGIWKLITENKIVKCCVSQYAVNRFLEHGVRVSVR